MKKMQTIALALLLALGACLAMGYRMWGARLDVDFVARLRDEVRFGSVEAMTAQMHDDARLARRLLGN